MKRCGVEVTVGLFMLLACAAFLFLAFKVSGLSGLSTEGSYYVTADFSNIGSLKVRSPVTIGGVRVGEVADIQLDPSSFIAQVTLKIDAEQDQLPVQDTSAGILTEGLLGSNYISITPGYYAEEDEDDGGYLQDGGQIQHTQPALILENLVGQFLFNMNK